MYRGKAFQPGVVGLVYKGSTGLLSKAAAQQHRFFFVESCLGHRLLLPLYTAIEAQ